MTQLQLTATVGGAAPASGAQASLDSLMPYKLDVACDPESIEVGISCGMSWMCGEHPCLCGVADHWGDCACNGFETQVPAIAVQSSNPHVAVLSMGDSWYVLGLAPEEADITVTASLQHYDDASQTMHVSCGGPSPLGILAIALALAVVAGAITLAVRAVRGAGRARAAAQTDGTAPQGETAQDNAGGDR